MLAVMLPVAVLAALPEVSALAPERRQALARDCADMIAAHGDDLAYGGKHCQTAFAALARGLAAGALQPGGVTFAGQHFCTRPHLDCPSPDMALLHARLRGLDPTAEGEDHESLPDTTKTKPSDGAGADGGREAR